MNLISKLPYELQIHISEYNPEHRKQMYWILNDICNNYCRCDVCDKIIIKYIYSTRSRRCTLQCCSSECVDRYDGPDHY